MVNLTITEKELNTVIRFFSYTFLFLTACFISSLDGETSSVFFKSISWAFFCTSTLFLVFRKWAWKIKIISKLMGRPVLNGVWIGYLTSDYLKTPENPPLRKPIVFLIRQTYLTLSLQSFTDSQTGESKLEALIQNSRTENTRLAYVFEMLNVFPGTRKLTSGTGDLRLLQKNNVLQGEYWTNSPTHGTLILKFQSKTCEDITCFEDAVRRWPVGPLWDVTL